MKYICRLGICFLFLIFLDCEKKNPPQSYLALGDSYTVGESVSK